MTRCFLLLLVGVLFAAALLAPASPASAQDSLRVLSYNIHHGEGTDGALDLERVARVIRAERPDVVLLQEVDSVTARTGRVDQAARLAELTGLSYTAFGRFMAYDGGAYGMAVLSAHPFEEVEVVRLPDGAEPRASVVARLQPGEGWPLMTFANVHLYRTRAERLEQARALLDHLNEEEGPAVLGGDFNSQPGGTVMRLVGAKGWKLPAKPGGAHRTWPSVQPETEIDFVLYRPAEAFEVSVHRVIDEPLASDHRPVLLVLTRADAP